MDKQKLALYMDHTNLKAFSGEADIIKLCDEAVNYGFFSVMVNPAYVKFCAEHIGGQVAVGTVVGFPLGAATVETKVFESIDAINNGASEIDYVVNIAEVKNGNFDYIKKEMEDITLACHDRGKAVKVIFENCYLSSDEIEKLCEIAKEIKPDFIKTSTGFGTYGARLEDVNLMKQTVGNTVKVKAAGGIRTLEDCMAMIEAGAERIGTSNSIDIVKALK